MLRCLLRAIPVCCATLIGSVTLHPVAAGAQGDARYRIEASTGSRGVLQQRFTEAQIELLGCIRLLERDAQWLFEWGQTWELDATATRMLTPGTPVFIVGRHDFDAPPPWRSLTWLSRTVELPSASTTDTDTAWTP
jgi:hypothetical protein